MKLNEAITLEEGLSPILYHATSMKGLLSILRSNKINLSRDGINRGRYYMSFSRNKSNDFIRYLMQLSRFDIQEEQFDPKRDIFAIIEFDGRKLSYNYAGSPFNTFYDPSTQEDVGMGINFQEDRLFSNKPYIERARQFIKGVTIILNDNDINENLLRKLNSGFNVKVYSYTEDYIYGEKPIDINRLKGLKSNEVEITVHFVNTVNDNRMKVTSVHDFGSEKINIMKVNDFAKEIIVPKIAKKLNVDQYEIEVDDIEYRVK